MKTTILIPLILFALFTGVVSCTGESSVDGNTRNLPDACFSMTSSTAMVGDEVKFSNCSKNATLFAWSFGDGEFSTEREPTHIYQSDGNFEVRLAAGEDINADGVLNDDDAPDSEIKTIEINPNPVYMEMTILSVENWTPGNPEFTPVSGANLLLYKNNPYPSFVLGGPDYTFTSDENGKVILLHDMNVDAECLLVEKDDKSNIVNNYVIKWIFESQEDIDNHAIQDDATIGGYRYVDRNGDGVISEDDQAPCYEDPFYSDEDEDETIVEDIIIGK